MKHSTVTADHDQEFTDVAKAVRGAMGEERVTASDLARQYGGAVSYWTRRITGQIPFNDRDLDLIARATGRHPAQFFGGSAPEGWKPFRGLADDTQARHTTGEHVAARHTTGLRAVA